MQTRFIRLFFAAQLGIMMACSVATIPVLAQGNSQGKGKAKGHDKKDKDDDRGPEQYQFRQQDREYISSYYSKHGKSMPPGQAKKNGTLPPGLERTTRAERHSAAGLTEKDATLPGRNHPATAAASARLPAQRDWRQHRGI
jgi:hypothetical protein